MKKILATVCALCLCSSQNAMATDQTTTNNEDFNQDFYNNYDSSSQYDDSYNNYDCSDYDSSNSFDDSDSSNNYDSSQPNIGVPDSSPVSDTSYPTSPPPDKTPFYGDVNQDNRINSEDALMVLKYVVGACNLNSEQFKRADVNRDHKVNTSDALCILKYVVGLINNFYAL